MAERREVLEILKNVYDPDYIDKSIVDMGLVDERDINITERGLEIEYKVTAPLCPFSSVIGVMIQYALEKKLNRLVHVRTRGGHMQTQLVNEVLRSEDRRKDLLKQLEAYGILERCVRT